MNSEIILEKRIDELKAELINQYILVFQKLHDMDEILQVRLRMDISSRIEVKKEKQTNRALTKIRQSYVEKFQAKTNFSIAEFDEIYKTMISDMGNPRYFEFSEKFNYSISDLVELLNQLVTLSSTLGEISNNEAEMRFKQIFYKYVEIDAIGYGILNAELKKKIDKTKVILGSRLKLRAEKARILKQLLINQSKQNGRWKSAYQAVKSCMSEIDRVFENFDKSWIYHEIEVSNSKIIMLKSKLESLESAISIKKANKQILDTEQWILLLEQALIKGYPYEDLKSFLPFNTSSNEELIMRTVRNDLSLIHQIIEK